MDAEISFSKQAVAERGFTVCVHPGQSTLQSLPSGPAARGALAFQCLGSCIPRHSKTSRKSFELALRIQVIDRKSIDRNSSAWRCLVAAPSPELQVVGAASPWDTPAAAGALGCGH